MALPKKVKGSTLILVLVILFVASLLLFFTMSALVSQTKQVKVEREKSKADLFAESALDSLTKKFLENPDDFLNNYVSGDSLTVPLSNSSNGLGICDPSATDIEKKCSADSYVNIKKFKYIFGFKLKHDETVQVTLAKENQNPTVSDIDFEFTDPNPSSEQQKYLVTSYYYENPTSNNRVLKVAGSCTVTFTNNSTDVACLGNISGSILSVPADKTDFGTRRVRFTFPTNYYPHFVRIKGLYSDVNKFTWVSITGKDYSNLPLEQMVLFDSHVYTYDNNNEVIHSHLVKTILVNPQMPEVMDWVFFNGSNQSVVK